MGTHLKKQNKKDRYCILKPVWLHKERDHITLFVFVHTGIQISVSSCRKSKNCTRTGYIHFITYYFLLVHETKERTQKKRERHETGPSNFGHTTSKTAEFDSVFFFFPNQQICCCFFLNFWQRKRFKSRLHVKIMWIFTVCLRTSGWSRGQMSCCFNQSMRQPSTPPPPSSSSLSSLECELAREL